MCAVESVGTHYAWKEQRDPLTPHASNVTIYTQTDLPKFFTHIHFPYNLSALCKTFHRPNVSRLVRSVQIIVCIVPFYLFHFLNFGAPFFSVFFALHKERVREKYAIFGLSETPRITLSSARSFSASHCGHARRGRNESYKTGQWSTCKCAMTAIHSSSAKYITFWQNYVIIAAGANSQAHIKVWLH